MGFNPNRTAKLRFSDPAFSEAEVVIRLSVSFERLMAIQSIQEQDSQTNEDMVRYLFDELVIEWNLEDDNGQPLPVDYKSAKKLPADFVGACVAAFGEAVGQPDAPLPEQSSNGLNPEELALSLSDFSRPN